MKIMYLNEKFYDDDGGYCSHNDDDIVISSVSSLDDGMLLRLLNEVLGTLNHPNRKNAKKLAIEPIKGNTGLITPGQAKTLDDLKVKGNSFLFPLGGWGNESVEVGKEDVDDYTIEKIVKMSKEPACFIQVEMPKHIQDKIDAYKVKLEKEEKAKEKRKKEKELEKARKILENAGEKVK